MVWIKEKYEVRTQNPVWCSAMFPAPGKSPSAWAHGTRGVIGSLSQPIHASASIVLHTTKTSTSQGCVS